MSMEGIAIVPDEDTTPEGHDEAMVAKMEGTEVPKPEAKDAGDRPEWLPEEFSSVEEMAAFAKEAKAKEAASTGDVPDPSTVEPAFVDSLQAEYDANGALSDESYSKLEGLGFSKEYVDEVIEAKKALAAQQTEALLESVGGSKGYSELVEWAKVNLSADEIAAHNAALAVSDESAKVAIEKLNLRYIATRGVKPDLLGGTKASQETKGYKSWAEVQEDMRSPKYKKDSAFRAAVEAKLAVSTL